jgi:hypothetical protein
MAEASWSLLVSVGWNDRAFGPARNGLQEVGKALVSGLPARVRVPGAQRRMTFGSSKRSPLMTFQIRGLPRTDFVALFGLTDAALAERGVIRMAVDASPGFPCRVSLRDLEVGETALLLNHAHMALPTPYRASHAIFVGEGAREAEPAPGEVPEVLRRRALSIRSLDADGMMLDADLVEGGEAEQLIERLLAEPRAAFLDIHNAKRGCFAARAVRA